MPHVLVLNASYEPLSVVHRHRAVGLVLAQRADCLEDSGEQIRSERVSIAMPSVIKLRYMAKVPFRKSIAVNGKNVCAHHKHVCAYCGEHATTVDHVIPRAHGGTNTWDNVVAACSDCNCRKADRTPTQAQMPLRYKPTEPRGFRYWAMSNGHNDAQWAPYLLSA